MPNSETPFYSYKTAHCRLRPALGGGNSPLHSPRKGGECKILCINLGLLGMHRRTEIHNGKNRAHAGPTKN